jgi:hypothetical protein
VRFFLRFLNTFHLSCKTDAAEARSKTFAQGGGGDKLKVCLFKCLLLPHRIEDSSLWDEDTYTPKVGTFSAATQEASRIKRNYAVPSHLALNL